MRLAGLPNGRVAADERPGRTDDGRVARGFKLEKTKSQLNMTPESSSQTAILNNLNLEFEQVQENSPKKINQITLDDSANIERSFNLLKSSHPYSTSRKSNTEISANNLLLRPS